MYVIKTYSYIMNTLLKYITILIVAVVMPVASSAFSLDTYAPSSVLSSGRWVKISVDESGMYLITNADLRAWGFSDPSKVNVYGYGGNRIPDHLTIDNYVDDLPMVQSGRTARGIVFYAVGPEKWTRVGNDNYIHSLNPYSTCGYYYLSDRDAVERPIIAEGSDEVAGTPVTTFTERLFHELDMVTPAESGHQLVGEDFRFTPSRTFNFQLTDRAGDDTEVWMQCDFFAKTTSAAGQLAFTANGATLPSASGDRVRPTEDYGDTCRIRKSFTVGGTSLSLGVRFSASGTVSLANLDNIVINYTRRIALPASGTLVFTASSRAVALQGGSERTTVWDITSPLDIYEMRTRKADSSLNWQNDYSGWRTYVAWNDNASFRSPKLVSVVANQDIHAQPVPDLVIVSHADLMTQSERIAEMHRNSADSLKVLVLEQSKVYNEFGSGSADINAIRNMLKMFYDRGQSGNEGRTLKHVLLMGGVNHDHRRLTSAMSSSRATTVPTWQTDLGTSENTSYCSDDMLTFLADGNGLRHGYEPMAIGVGRIAVRTASDAKSYVDRLVSYVNTPSQGEWRNRVLFLADDEDRGEHAKQTEDMEKALRGTASGQGFTYHKVYLDAFEMQGGVSQAARDKMYGLFDDGVIWWNYIGHANINSLTGEGQFTLNDLNNLYLRRPFFFYGATCSFGHWDGAAVCGLESLVVADSGGAIAGLTAVRPVYIARNGVLTVALGQEAFARNADGRFNTIGEVIRRAKNKVSDDNKLRYVLLGDPAMRLAIPENSVVLESIDGVEVNEENQVTVKVLGKSVFRGAVVDIHGVKMTDFNGWMSMSLYDAEQSNIAVTKEKDQTETVFEEQGERLYTGRAKVVDGEFEVSIVLPPEVSHNFRNATLNMYAVADDGRECAGVCRDFYVYGFDEDAVPDDVPPVIEYMYLNHESFADGDVVDAVPMLIARVKDDVGLNMSSAGIGHQMSLLIDESSHFTDLSSHYTPDADGSPAGEILYQLPELTAGNHTAMLKVWDIAGNSTTASIDFFVDPSATPKIFDVYSDANPATVAANFYVVHNLPDAMLTVKVEVFDLNGALMWSGESRGRADMYTSSPITWDLTNKSGQRVGRGIYVYKTTVITEGNSMAGPVSSSQTKRIAVSAM